MARPSFSTYIVLSAFLAAASLGAAAVTPTLPSANQVMDQARARAAAEHKNILLTFSASWCGPCHMFEHFLADPTIQPIVSKSFIIASLESGERQGDPNHSNSPGGEDLKASLGGKDAGFPYIIMLTAAGKPIVSSMRPVSGRAEGENVGYPAVPVEIDWFMTMLDKSAPQLNDQDKATIRAWLTAHAHPGH
jgi:thiol-disulfide isomerase/thioredoxin